MPRDDQSSVRISGIHNQQRQLRHAPYHKPASPDDDFLAPIPPAVTPVKAATKLDPMLSPPHTPPSLSHSQTATPCTSAEPSPVRRRTSLPDSSEPSSSSKREEVHVRRPANPFILFACEYRKGHKGKNNRELSKQAGELWKALTVAEKQVWKDKATSVKEKHAADHPGYRYQPRRKEKTGRSHRVQDEEPMSKKPALPIFPQTPESLPRKSRASGRSRASNNWIKFKEGDGSYLDASILSSPTLHSKKALSKLRNFIGLSPSNTPHPASELTLPTLSQRAVSPLARPTTPAFNNYGPDVLTTPQWPYLSHGVGEHWSNFPQVLPDFGPVPWDQSSPFAPNYAPAPSNFPTAVNDGYSLFNQYDPQTFGIGSGPFSIMGEGAGSFPSHISGPSLNGV
ncbi:hypothetical protein DFH11DRAFT_83154 [Phellopilus nigrolimitatus]|nr:hypothetical protein DFH11DRAFT_83154 [Phellopilus nigrolimitatus]